MEITNKDYTYNYSEQLKYDTRIIEILKGNVVLQQAKYEELVRKSLQNSDDIQYLKSEIERLNSMYNGVLIKNAELRVENETLKEVNKRLNLKEDNKRPNKDTKTHWWKGLWK